MHIYIYVTPTHTTAHIQAVTMTAAGAETKRQLLTGRKCVLPNRGLSHKNTLTGEICHLLNLYFFSVLLLASAGNESRLNQTWSCFCLFFFAVLRSL